MQNPTLFVGFQFLDLGVILLALYMKKLRNYRILMLVSGFVGIVGYWGNIQMIIIKSMVISIMVFKLATAKNDPLAEAA